MSIQEYLDAEGMTAQQLAEKSGVSASTICRWRQGHGGQLAKFARVVAASKGAITCTVKAPPRRGKRAA
jgi:transcriptional regulator with XRE-family HTH domain